MTSLPPSRPLTGRASQIAEALAQPSGRFALADELEAILWRHVLDAHWPATVDREYGGFLTDLDRRWRPCGPHEKNLEFQARQTWVFARAAALYPGRGYEEAARHGFAFLRDRMWDTGDSGFFTLVDRQGHPLADGRKHPHGHAYAIEACVAMAPLIGEHECRRWAEQVLGWLDAIAWDGEHCGYWGYFERDGTRIMPVPETNRDQYDWIGTPNGLKDLNVLGDTMGALTTLVTTGWGAAVESKLQVLFRLYVDRLIPDHGLLAYLYTRDWKPLPDLARAGNPLQTVTALIVAAGALGVWDDVIQPCERVAQACRRFFAHPMGGMMFAQSFTPGIHPGLNVSVPVRSWWVQMEASRAALLLALLLPDEPSHRDAFARQWTFVEEALLDVTYCGTYATAEEGARARRPLAFLRPVRKTHRWKDATHDGHFLMDAVEWLRSQPPIPPGHRSPELGGASASVPAERA